MTVNYDFYGQVIMRQKKSWKCPGCGHTTLHFLYTFFPGNSDTSLICSVFVHLRKRNTVHKKYKKNILVALYKMSHYNCRHCDMLYCESVICNIFIFVHILYKYCSLSHPTWLCWMMDFEWLTKATWLHNCMTASPSTQQVM